MNGMTSRTTKAPANRVPKTNGKKNSYKVNGKKND